MYYIKPDGRINWYKKGLRGAIELDTVNSEIFASILFSRIALKDIFATLKFAHRACFTNICEVSRK